LQFAANLEKVGFDAYHGAPAAGNVSGSISGDLGHGELRLDTEAFMLHLYPIFAKPWHYQKANARLTWARQRRFHPDRALPQGAGRRGQDRR
jgi:uncharacterized protein YhdP